MQQPGTRDQKIGRQASLRSVEDDTPTKKHSANYSLDQDKVKGQEYGDQDTRAIGKSAAALSKKKDAYAYQA